MPEEVMEREIVVKDCEERKESVKKKTGLIMFSGGYDSTALLHYLICSKEFSKLEVVYEWSNELAGEHEINSVKKVYDFINENYAKKNNVELEWIEEKINLSWICSYNGREVCLSFHLMTIMRHGEVKNFYLGWNKSNVETLELSKQMLEWFNKMKFSEIEIHFLEDTFYGNNGYETKTMVIRHLLENNLFGLPFTSSDWDTEEEFANRKYWYKNGLKETEVANALVNTMIFNSEELSKIFSFKTTNEVQELYNKRLTKYDEIILENKKGEQ